MGCGGSKVDDLPLVTLCRERKELVKAAAEHRYAFAAAHVSYFYSLKEVGESFKKFVDEELVIGAGSSPDSPVLTLPSDEGKPSKSRNRNSSSSTSISHSLDDKKVIDGEDSHLHLSSGSDSDLDSGHIHIHNSEEEDEDEVEEGAANNGIHDQHYQGPPFYSSPDYNSYYGQQNWGYNYPPPNGNFNFYYMKKSPTPAKSIVYEEPERQFTDSGYGHMYSGYPPMYANGGYFGFSMGSPSMSQPQQQPSPPARPPEPPSPPRVSTWDYLNVFDTYDNNSSMYPGYSKYGYRSSTSSPDSTIVREREGIPELEDDTESEALMQRKLKRKVNLGDEGTSRSVPMKHSPSSEIESLDTENDKPTAVPREAKSSSGSIDSSIVSKISEEDHSTRKKGVSFEVEDEESSIKATAVEIESSKVSTVSVQGTRDLKEVVEEIRVEFETASSFGKEVALLLEVGKLPYHHRTAPLKVIFSRILYLVAPWMLSSRSPRRSTVRISSRTMKMAKEYCQEMGGDFDMNSGNLSSTLDKLYAWEKKLYKEVKDEEKLRLVYEKKCKELRMLDDQGAEASKVDATQASIRKLQTKINVSIRAVDTISTRIHMLRDEELQPQLIELVHGLIRMWRSMLKCHQKQFQAVMESKVRSLKANTSFQKDSGLKATLDLEMELLNWCNRFNSWVRTQKSYVESLNEWLSKCLLHETEDTPDGPAPFSPGRIGAPPIFVVCNDWYQAIDRISEKEVCGAMSGFASTLHQLWERQDEEQRQRIKAEYLSKDFEQQLRTLRLERGKRVEEHDQDALSDKTAVSKVSDSGVSPLDDLKVDLDSMRKKIEEERARHKETIKLVHNAASSSLQAGLIPIFEALNNFSSEVVKAHDQVRLDYVGGS